MKIEALSLHEGEKLGGATHRAIIDTDDLTETTAATAQTIELLTVALGDQVKLISMQLIDAFEDASDAAFNDVAITVGDGGDVDRFLASTQVNENGTEVLAAPGIDTAYAYVAADTVDVVVNSMTAKSLSDLDLGELHLYFRLNSFPRRVQT